MARWAAGSMALAVVAVVAAFAAPQPGGTMANADDCYRIWAEAQEEGARYRHLVYVRNDCDYWIECTVWTDATPQPPKLLTVGPGETEQAETTGDSASADPKAFGACRKK